jgi:phosphatidylglycerophosphate synthase
MSWISGVAISSIIKLLRVDLRFTSSGGRVHCPNPSESHIVGLRTTHTLEETQLMQKSKTLRFREAKRIQQSFLATVEKQALLWLAARTPAWVNSDHLTILGLTAMAGAGAGYWWSRWNPAGLLIVVACLALNWLGDSLDGTLARFRNCPRPRYGFYVDHVVDAFSALFLLSGLAVSGYMSPWLALGLLLSYLMLSIEVYLASYTLGDFRISYFKMGPTELRLLLSVGNVALLWKPIVHLAGRSYRMFDAGATIGISGMMLVLLISVVENTARLYRREPLPGTLKTAALANMRLASEQAKPGARQA